MASGVTRKQFIIQNENLDIHQKKVDGKTKGSKTATKKSGVGFGSRKALNDITNKSSFNREASSKNKKPLKEDFNVAEEKFLHDHNKCIKEQQAMLNKFKLDLVLPGHDSASTAEYLKSKQVAVALDSRRCSPEPVEMPIPELSVWIDSSIQRESPPCSPMHCDYPPSSPFAWQFDVEFELKQDNDI
ncbi:hypothetical protein CFOL_v3_05621 [Cephalotus follicularis]|uniref:Protein PATRONUS 2 n=1 Tax=Cephalotus follicularis TaxID=3775 RepID=A0A1Q3B254_CEPFO|nr:hypothetical protein CFOL_v3_05621 [Cephalotus follicularis]